MCVCVSAGVSYSRDRRGGRKMEGEEEESGGVGALLHLQHKQALMSPLQIHTQTFVQLCVHVCVCALA